mgnify:CR=1 FL=1
MKDNKVLFVHDGPMFTYNGRCYHNQVNNKLIERYTHLGENVCFLMRSKSIKYQETHNYKEITHPSFSFMSIPNSRSISTIYKKGEVSRIIHNKVDESAIVIARLPSSAGVAAVRYALKIKKPVLVEFVACVYDALWNYDWRGKLLAHLKMWQYQRLMERIPYSIYVTQEFLQNRYPNKNGVSLGCSDVEIGSLNEDDLIRRLNRIHNSGKQIVLGTVAAIDVPYKGQADVINCIKRLKNRGVEIQYKVVGQGNPEKLYNLIEEFSLQNEVEIIGSLSHDKVFEFLDNIDIYIQPSRQEGLPRSVIEAMSRALPSIGTNIAGIPELIEEEYMYDKNDPSKMDDIIMKLFNKENMLEQAARNFKWVERYESKKLNEIRTDFYDMFLKKNDLLE